MTSLRWGVYTAQIQYIDSATAKVRPVIAVTEPRGKFKILLVVPLYSTRKQTFEESDIDLTATTENGLLKSSVLRLNRMVALPAASLMGQLGSLSEKDVKSVQDGLRQLFAL